MRLFIALPLAGPARAAAAALQQRLRDAAGPGARVSWPDPAQLHLTLAFLGEQPGPEAAEAALRAAVAEHPRFGLVLAGLGVFPTPARPRVLWLGATEGAERLAALAATLRARLLAAGVQPEKKPFHGHVTLGRVKPGGDRAARGALVVLKSQDQEAIAVAADALVLVESKLGPGGARHTELCSAPLAGG